MAEVIDNTTSRGRTIRFLFDGPYEEFKKTIQRLGETPLPKIHKRNVIPEDEVRYQTIYAKHEGAVAAPTAGLHFTEAMLDGLGREGVEIVSLTLHVGPGTFQPVKAEDPRDHRLDPDRGLLADAGGIEQLGDDVVLSAGAVCRGANAEPYTLVSGNPSGRALPIAMLVATKAPS